MPAAISESVICHRMKQGGGGTPMCVTVDYTTLEDDTVTVRDRDTMKQDRINISKLVEFIDGRLA